MSTIEKAAARLAARAKGSAAADAGTTGAIPAADPATVEARSLDSERGAARSIPDPAQEPGVPAPEREPFGHVERTPPPAVSASQSSNANDSDRRCRLDLDALRERGYLTPGATRSPLAQQMRRMKRPLLLRMQKARANPEAGPPANLIMITSSLPGEGKTFTSINLAMSIAAEVDHRVLLVDADPSRGDISQQFGLLKRRSLTGVLDQGSDYIEGEIFETNVERLSILPAGEPIEHIDELFASEVMANIVHSLAMADPTRVIIFDSAPLLAATEVAVLARLMGQIVVVVEANRTPQDAVLRGLTMLEGCANVSLVLNKSTGTGDDGYGYGMSYGAFGGDGTAHAQQTGGATGEGR